MRRSHVLMDQMIGDRYSVLDHGFVRLIDYMGTDECIVEAARVSYQKGTEAVRSTEGLINYLMREGHTSPFEMCEIKFHIKLPIFVARQWVRHRTASINEVSGRYSVLPTEFYVPDIAVLGRQSTMNKQGTGDPISGEEAGIIRREIYTASSDGFDYYNELLNGNEDHDSISREHARIVLPLNTYTEWYWKVNANNLMRFLALRLDPHAQHEIRAYANILAGIMETWLPLASQAFYKYWLNVTPLSKNVSQAVKKILLNFGVNYMDALPHDVVLTVAEKKELDAFIKG